MNKPVTTFGLVASMVLAATALATETVSAGLTSNYVGASQALADIGQRQHQAVRGWSEDIRTVYPDTGRARTSGGNHYQRQPRDALSFYSRYFDTNWMLGDRGDRDPQQPTQGLHKTTTP